MQKSVVQTYIVIKNHSKLNEIWSVMEELSHTLLSPRYH